MAENEGYSSSFDDRAQYPPNANAHRVIEVSARTDASTSTSTSTSATTTSSVPPFDRLVANERLNAIDLNSCAKRSALKGGYVRIAVRFLGGSGGIGSVAIIEPNNVGEGALHCIEDVLRDVAVPRFNREDIVVNHTWFVDENGASQRVRGEPQRLPPPEWKVVSPRSLPD